MTIGKKSRLSLQHKDESKDLLFYINNSILCIPDVSLKQGGADLPGEEK